MSYFFKIAKKQTPITAKKLSVGKKKQGGGGVLKLAERKLMAQNAG